MMITDGILNIDKPQNMTSHDVVSAVRRLTGVRRVGHTGTLDPMATGVLPVCIGRAARIMEYLDMDLKTYRCTMVLGITTDTQDIWGNVISRSPVSAGEEEIRQAFVPFHGVIDQKPPMYSALKVNGKKLYEYAREGKTVDVKSRKVYIDSLEIEKITSGAVPEVSFTVRCTKGTYIRTICQDAGQALGCGAAMTGLRRLASGAFDAADAVSLEELKEMDGEALTEKLLPADYPLTAFGKVVACEDAALRFITGWHLPLELCRIVRKPLYEEKDFFLPVREEFRHAYNVYGTIDGEERFLGVAFYSSRYRKLVADKVFYVR